MSDNVCYITFLTLQKRQYIPFCMLKLEYYATFVNIIFYIHPLKDAYNHILYASILPAQYGRKKFSFTLGTTS